MIHGKIMKQNPFIKMKGLKAKCVRETVWTESDMVDDGEAQP